MRFSKIQQDSDPFLSLVVFRSTSYGSGTALPAYLPSLAPPKQTLLPWFSFSRQL
jgi:hypothetical protein